jgi:hypothetical protein
MTSLGKAGLWCDDANPNPNPNCNPTPNTTPNPTDPNHNTVMASLITTGPAQVRWQCTSVLPSNTPVRYGARFRQRFKLVDAIGSHASRLKLLHACDQCHSSRGFTPLTGWHCKFRPNTEGWSSLPPSNWHLQPGGHRQCLKPLHGPCKRYTPQWVRT